MRSDQPKCQAVSWLLLLSAAVFCQSVSAAPSVSFNGGTVTGVQQNNINKFLGIPFARAGRFQSPKIVTNAGNIDGTNFGPACLQAFYNSATKQIEQLPGSANATTCLTVNVWTPSGTASATGGYPVMFWIYGGGFIEGFSNNPLYDLSNMAIDAVNNGKPMVFVSINYRVAYEGFAANKAFSGPQGMFGIEDQRVGMQWVRQNIAAFNGDPRQVTIWGQSAGGISTCIHLVSPLSAGLFQAAILESGNCQTLSSLEQSQASTSQLAQALNCPSKTPTGELNCLNAASDAQLMAANIKAGGGEIFGPTLAPLWKPSVNGFDVIEQPIVSFNNKRWNTVPVIMGANYKSCELFAGPGSFLSTINTADKYNKYVNILVDKLATEAVNPAEAAAGAAKLKSDFQLTDADNSPQKINQKFVEFFSDGVFLCGVRMIARTLSSQVPTFYYNFRAATGVHGAEIPVLFNTTVGAVDTSVLQPGLGSWLRGYWTAFGWSQASVNTAWLPPIVWPAFNPSTSSASNSKKSMMVFQDTATMLDSGYLDNVCQGYDAIIDGLTYPAPPNVTVGAAAPSGKPGNGSKGTGALLGGLFGSIFLLCILVKLNQTRREAAKNGLHQNTGAV